MNKAIFLDRDGTINVDKNYLFKPDDFELLPGVAWGLRKMQEAGYLLLIITNQSGIGRGYYTEKDLKKLNRHMLSVLESQKVHISDIFYCPHLPDAKIEQYRRDCQCRKPRLGMFYEAVEKWNVDLTQSWAIGDRERDCAICKDTGCKGIIISHGAQNMIGLSEHLYFTASFSKAAMIVTEGE